MGYKRRVCIIWRMAVGRVLIAVTSAENLLMNRSLFASAVQQAYACNHLNLCCCFFFGGGGGYKLECLG